MARHLGELGSSFEDEMSESRKSNMDIASLFNFDNFMDEQETAKNSLEFHEQSKQNEKK